MKKIILSAIVLISSTVFAQDCSKNIQFKQGVVITTTNYNEKDKTTGSSKATVTAVTSSGTTVTANIKSESFDKDGKSNSTGEFTITCSNGKIIMDMKMMMSGQEEIFKGSTMTIEGDNMEIPDNLTVGQTLPDTKVKMTFTKDGANTGTMDILIKNRKVEGKESITTTAGTFECYKISYEVESAMVMMMGTMQIPGFKNSSKAVMYYNIENGSIKTESYSEKGKLISYSLVTDIKK